MTQHKSLIGLCLSAFLMMLGVGMIVALLPQRMLNLTGQASSAAYLTSAFAFSYVLLQVPYGNFSDRLGFKRFLMFGYLLCTLTGLLYYAARTVDLILFGRLLQGAGEAPVWSLAPALLSIRYPAAKGKTLGIYNASMHLGLTLGPVVGILMTNVWGRNDAFLFYGGTCLVGSAVLHFSVGDVASAGYAAERTNFRNVLSIATQRDNLVILTGIALYGAGYASFLTVIPVFLLSERGFLQIAVGLHFALFYVTVSLSQLVVGPLSDRVGRTVFLVLGFAVAAAGVMMLPSLGQPWVLVTLTVASLGFGTFHVASMARLNENVTDELKGTMSGAYYLFWGLGYFSGPLLLSELSESTSFEVGFYSLSLLLLLEVVVIVANARGRLFTS